MSIKLKQLPEREPKKVTIALPPQIYRDLETYAGLYEQTYGRSEQPGDLIPPMIEAFLASDNVFKRAQKAREKSSQPTEVQPAKE